MNDILRASEKLFSELDLPARELLLDAVTGFRDAIESLGASPTLADRLEVLLKNEIGAFIVVVVKALQKDGAKRLFDEIGSKSKTLCPQITEAINARFDTVA